MRTFINELKDEQLGQLRNKDARIESIRQSSDMAAPEQSAAAFSGKISAEEKVRELTLQKQSLQQFRNSVAAARDGSDRVFSGSGAAVDPQLAAMLADYNKAAQQKEQLQAQYGEDSQDPRLAQFDADLNRRRRQMLAAADRAVSNIDMYIRSAAQNLSQYNQQVSSVPTVDRGLNDVRREYEVTQGTYLLLYQKGIENEISLNAATVPGKVIIAPNGPGAPMSPIPRNIYGMALALGFLLPIAIIIAKELLDSKLYNEKDVTMMSHVPIIGSVSEGYAISDIVVGENIRTSISEQFRLIRTNIDFMTGGASKTPTIMITSSMSGEGKTFISMNLALTMAVTGKRVVLMEFDMRKPKITERLNLDRQGGMSGFLAGISPIEQVLRPSGLSENLFIAVCGPTPPNPAELLLSPKCNELFDALKEHFDIIVIDTAPVGLVSDALILSQYADMNISVVRQRVTQKGQVGFLDSLSREGKLKPMAFVLNGIQQDKRLRLWLWVTVMATAMVIQITVVIL